AAPHRAVANFAVSGWERILSHTRASWRARDVLRLLHKTSFRLHISYHRRGTGGPVGGGEEVAHQLQLRWNWRQRPRELQQVLREEPLLLRLPPTFFFALFSAAALRGPSH